VTYRRMATEIHLVDRWKGMSKRSSMEGFDLITVYDVDVTVMCGID